MSKLRKTGTLLLSAMMTLSLFSTVGTQKVQAASFTGALEKVDSVQVEENVATISFNDGKVKGKITFLEDGIFRYNVDPSGEFSEYPAYRNGYPTSGKIVAQPDSSDRYAKPEVSATKKQNSNYEIKSGTTTIEFDQNAAMTVKSNGIVVMQESKPLQFNTSSTVQTLVQHTEFSNTSASVAEQFYGGGTQNGRMVHTGEVINIENESNWVDGGVSSPNPFYYTTNGYGVLRNTWMEGKYDFGSTNEGVVTTTHNENEYDAYIFVSDAKDGSSVTQELLDEYYTVTGNPILLPEYGFYLGHFNAYNRDTWDVQNDASNSGQEWTIKGNESSTSNGTSAYEFGRARDYVASEGQTIESLNGDGPLTEQGINYSKDYSARTVLDRYMEYDMPFGYFVPNDGYGAGYGQNGYYQTGGVDADGNSSEERLAAVAANVANLEEFVDYVSSKGVATGLWTQSNLTPDSNNKTYWHLLRDFKAEVAAGVTTLKTDVAWVGSGYSFQLSGVKEAYNIITQDSKVRPNIVSLDGWAGSQRYNSVWTGDQTGGNWEYIRFHIPTFIGQSLSGNPNIGSDMDGIFGGNEIIATRDYQWKSFAPQMLDMDGWGSNVKSPYTFGDPYTSISRMYLKMKAMMMPYTYTNAYAAANIDTGNDDTGLPMVRAMFLEFPEESFAYTLDGSQYQYMWGESLLVAPLYEDTKMDATGNDVRDGIYLPGGEDQIWIDYFTGKQYTGGQVLNNYKAPLWKLPLFVKNGAIIPMYAEHNNPLPSTADDADSLDKTIRLIEFWPEADSSFTAIEDDGISMENTVENVESYGDQETINYGSHVSTTYTSKVEGETATLTANAATGSYTGYDSNKDTTFIVNVSKKPESIVASNGANSLEIIKVESKEAFDSTKAEAEKAVYFYDESPDIETFASEDTELAKMVKDVQVSPKLYVKFAKTDTQANAQTLVINGFENEDVNLPVNQLNEDLAAPTNLHDVEEEKTPTSNTIAWDEVESATSYELLIDDMVYEVGNNLSFMHTDQPYNSTHTYKVRSRNEQGYSKWSAEIEATTSQDPWRNVPTPENVIWTGGDQYGALKNATDHDTNTMFHSTGDVVTNAVPFILDYGSAYQLDKLEYYPRDNYGNGTVQQLDVYTSLDGVHWIQQYDGSSQDNWTYDTGKPVTENVKTVSLTGAARYVKLVVTKSSGNFFSANEIAVYKQDGSKAFAVGSTNFESVVSLSDYTNMKQYLGTSPKDGSDFTDQIKARYGDINNNNVYDVYDYAFTMFNLNGGTEQTGKVSGDILLIPSNSEVNDGETFTIDVYADNVKNLNAFGEVLDYDPTAISFESVTAEYDIIQMENLTVNKNYSDEEAYLNLAFANNGNQETYSGTGVIAKITMKALTTTKVSEAIDLTDMMLIGPEFDFIEGDSYFEVQMPELAKPESKTYQYEKDFTMTMTNNVLTEDDGTNVEKFIQTNTYDGLFNGNVADREEFELKLNTNLTTTIVGLPDYVSVPVTLHVNLRNDKELSKVVLYNANKGNGFVLSATATYYYSDETNESKNISYAYSNVSEYQAFEFTNPNASKQVDYVDITIEKVVNSQGNSVNNMLTLSELEIYDNSTKLAHNTDFTMTMTNDVLTNDDGSNVKKMIQQAKYDGLFNGDKGREFEFKWDIESNYVENEVKYVELPVVLHMNLTEAKEVEALSVFNTKIPGNGYLTDATATFIYTDGSKESVNLKGQEHEFKFTNPDVEKKVTNVDIQINATTDPNGKMLTLTELKLVSPVLSVIPVTGISADDENQKELYIGNLADINAIITPEDASNPYFTVSSSDNSIIRIITLKDNNGLPIYKAYAVGSGEATITITALETVGTAEPIEVSYKINVLKGADKSKLVSLLDDCKEINPNFYSEESYKVLSDAILNAQEVVKDDEATNAEVKQTIEKVQAAIDGLVELPVEEIKDKSKFKVDAAYSDSNYPTYLVDGNETNRWESPYVSSASLPQDIIIDLGGEYDLDKVEIVKYMGQINGRVTDFEVFVSVDNGQTYESVGRKTTAADEQKSGIRFEKKNVTNVMIRIYAALNADGSAGANYAGLSEINFYGSTSVEKTELTALYDANVNKTNDGYTSASWEDLQKALVAAKAVLDDNQATQAQIQDAYDELNAAVNGLVKKADVSVLSEMIKEAEAIDTEKFTADSVEALNKVLAEAKALAANENATQQKVDDMVKALDAAIKGLEKADSGEVTPDPTPETVNKKDLWALLETYDGYQSVDYTKESWTAFYEAYQKASEIVLDKNATQEEVDQAVKDLKAAGEALVAVSDTGDDEKADGEEITESEETKKPADTASEMPILPYAAVTLLAAGGAYIVLRKKYGKNEASSVK